MSERLRTRSGGWLHVEDAGAGRPLLAIHGLGGGAWFFSGFAQRLAAVCRVITVDLPGTGRSVDPSGAPSPVSAIRPEAWIDDLLDLLNDRAGEPAVVVGHSMGTILALQAFAAKPSAIRSMIFVGGLPEARPPIKERLTQRMAVVRGSGMDGLGATAVTANFSAAAVRRFPETAAMFARLFELQDPDTYRRCCEILIGLSAAPLASRVDVPCLAISGRDDQYAPPEAVAEFMAQVPGGRGAVVLDDCAHLPFLEAPDEFAAAVRAFLASSGVC